VRFPADPATPTDIPAPDREMTECLLLSQTALPDRSEEDRTQYGQDHPSRQDGQHHGRDRSASG
jgi:hypothetical protein